MKKTYSKPKIHFDNFELSQSIAADCEVISNFSRGTCGVDAGVGDILFTEGYSVCSMVPAPGMYDGVCYDVPFSDNNVFSS